MPRGTPRGLEARAHALEEQFFRKRDAELLERLRREREARRGMEGLARATGVHDEAVLASLVERGIGAESLTALVLVPLVAVAWADERLTEAERLEVLRAARELGVEHESAAHALLERWLGEQPDPGLYDAWRAYVRALAEELGPERARAVEHDMLERAREVAKVGGGLTGLGRVSGAQRRAIEALAGAAEGE